MAHCVTHPLTASSHQPQSPGSSGHPCRCVLAAALRRWVFEYYVVAKPMVRPVRALLDMCWPCLGGPHPINMPWLLAAFRIAPAVLLCQVRCTAAALACAAPWPPPGPGPGPHLALAPTWP